MQALRGRQNIRGWLAAAALVVVAIGSAWWWWSSKQRGRDTARPATSSVRGPLSADAGSGVSAVPSSPPTNVIRLSGAPSGRRQLAERIAAAANKRRAAAASDSPSAIARPALPQGSSAMDNPEHVVSQMQSVFKQVKGYVAECVKQSGAEIKGFKAELSLTGDPDIGTLIDASALTGADGQSLPAQFDDCVRSIMQSLELPPMAVGDEFKVNYEFLFD